MQTNPLFYSLLPLVVVLAVGCGTGSTAQTDRAERQCEAEPPRGNPEMVSIAGQNLKGISVGAVEFCDDEDQGYLWLTPTSGSRSVVTGRDESGEVAGCNRPPNGPDDCPALNADLILRTVAEDLGAEGVDNVGYGLGTCWSDGPRTDEDKGTSLVLHDWSPTDQAVRRLAARMRAWDIADPIGVSVRSKPCAQLR